MSEDIPTTPGTIGWHDLTVENAAEIRDFYSKVIGWKSEAVSQGDYDDYSMFTPQENDCVAGICHARGSNSKIPPQWLVYINVANAEESCKACVDGGGKIIDGPRPLMGGSFAVIQDPAGAVCAIYQPA